MNIQHSLITILGPTAVGKTTFAAHLALELDAEIISADSRQVFKGMDIGTGKDLADYKIGDRIIANHLIDIVEPGSEYNVFQFQKDFERVWSDITSRQKTPVLCGGTGLYLESVLLGYEMNEVPVDENLRIRLSALSDNQLVAELSLLRTLHNTTDILDRERLLRAIEIELYKQANQQNQSKKNFLNTPVLGLRHNRKIIRERITSRLTQRLQEGMIEEVQLLLDKGISIERLKMYGLEYKYVTLFLTGELTYNQMFTLLNTAIHQFAKRQMTWFRRMENKGVQIFWLEGEDDANINMQKAVSYIKNFKV